jgi:hypothetical protein
MAFRRPIVVREGQLQQLQAADRLHLGKISLGPSPTTLGIVGGAITVTDSWHKVDTEGLTGTDNLETILGGEEGDILVLTAAHDSRTVSVRDNTGNCRLAGNFNLDHTFDTITLMFNGTFWLELARSNNG